MQPRRTSRPQPTWEKIPCYCRAVSSWSSWNLRLWRWWPYSVTEKNTLTIFSIYISLTRVFLSLQSALYCEWNVSVVESKNHLRAATGWEVLHIQHQYDRKANWTAECNGNHAGHHDHLAGRPKLNAKVTARETLGLGCLLSFREPSDIRWSWHLNQLDRLKEYGT